MIALRYKKLNSGSYSIYLDISGKDENDKPFRKYDFLKIHVSKDYRNTNRVLAIDKDKMELAISIKAKKELELNGSVNNKDASSKRVNLPLFSYIDNEYQKTNRKNYSYLNKNLKKFTKDKEILLSDVDVHFIERFASFLDETLASNTKVDIIAGLKKFINMAYRQDLITFNPFKKYKLPKRQETNIDHLDLHELQKLSDTPTSFNPQIRQAFFFSCFTGLRFIDLISLKWSQILITKDKNGEEYVTLLIRPSKTINTSGKLLRTPLAKQAQDILKEVNRKPDCDIIFYTLKALTGKAA